VSNQLTLAKITMAQRWTIRNYNAFLRQAKSTHKINHWQAQQLYRSMKTALKRSCIGADIKRHPRVAQRELKRIPIERKLPKIPEALERTLHFMWRATHTLGRKRRAT